MRRVTPRMNFRDMPTEIEMPIHTIFKNFKFEEVAFVNPLSGSPQVKRFYD